VRIIGFQQVWNEMMLRMLRIM